MKRSDGCESKIHNLILVICINSTHYGPKFPLEKGNYLINYALRISFPILYELIHNFLF